MSDWSATPGSSCRAAIAEYCTTYSNFMLDGLDPECSNWWHLTMDCGYTDLSPTSVRTFQYGATYGRGGKGTVYVFSSGNEHDVGEDINYEGELFDAFGSWL